MKRVHLISNMVILKACLFFLQLVLRVRVRVRSVLSIVGEVGKMSMSCKRKFRELKNAVEEF